MVLRLWFLLICFLFLLPSRAITQADNNLLIVSNQDGNRDIYRISPDGSNLNRLTTDPAEDIDPAWSPDRTQIAFASNRSGSFAIYVMDVDGTNARRLTGDNMGSYNASPTWSPDAQSLAFVSNSNGHNEIYVMGVDGSNPRRISDSRGESIDPAWSPDGQWIAFAANTTSNFEIYTMRPDGQALRQLTNDPTRSNDSPAWSVDGTLLAYAGNGLTGDIYIMNADGSDVRVLAGSEDAFATAPSWSPDGQEISYVLTPYADDGAVYLIDKNGMAARTLPNISGEVSSPVWSALRPIAPVVEARPIAYALVQTGYGATLNMRAEASINARIVEELPYGTPVSVLAGPIDADGFRWWQVISPTGQTGWAVEYADRIETLQHSNSPQTDRYPYNGQMVTSANFAFGEAVQTILTTEVWTRPTVEYGEVTETLIGGTVLDIAGIPFAAYDRQGRLVWWYLVQANRDEEPLGWVMESVLE